MPPWIPNPAECRRLLHDAGAPAWVLEHCHAVARLACACLDCARTSVSPAVRAEVLAGALLHDIGRSVTQDLRHAYLGADLLRAAGVAEPVCRIVETHTGAGLSPNEAAGAGLPERDYLPATLAERLVAGCDNCYSGVHRLTAGAVAAKYAAKDLLDAATRIAQLDANLAAVLGVAPFACVLDDATTLW